MPAVPPEGAPDADLAAARRVLATEAAALGALAESLDGAFGRAVSLLAGARDRTRDGRGGARGELLGEPLGEPGGRVVVSGMGKSGHVGRKIAATFASTGTPALFVHPGEASHGDLGMVLPGDVLLALSNSGETSELADLVAHSRRFAIPLVAITGRADSTLARAADVALVLPAAPEACPMGLAPTTSTTLQMALGDALAVALLTRRGFTAADFRVFHPGGKLGAKLSRVRALMHTGEALPLAGPETRMDAAIVAMTAKHFGCLGIVEDGRLVGVITDGDLRRALDAGAAAGGPGDLLGRTAAEVMTRAPRTIGPDQLAAEALHLMNARSITALFVVDAAQRPVGILHVHDLLRTGVA
ncbi:KpsF/GutQ family sugar-phosphate isomerase [Roseomonas sp. NAR14]|uniref:KpsF/GutQ family sugar-phosphate isomerase n=1 Tax=Roseomonas acroporae TaxID=2937791 RepID=A0A9X1Y649_9PROT|nr:KpsF/GutQ family sugar-phosphate isomerase [Roseomonas acroporae]MCK8784689.1 KpsF/GutQ family sugar-phosphate isomerase [Roseomonas acroporae]